MRKRASPTLIGAFVVGAVVLAVVAIGVFGSGRYFRKVYPYVVYFGGDVNGLKVGAPVKFRGIQVGDVRSILLSFSDAALSEEQAAAFRIPVVIELDEDYIVSQGAHTGADPESVARLVDLGLRAQLKTESFVTGILYVDLGFFPNTPIEQREVGSEPYPEIPTLPTALEEAQMKVEEFLSKLEQVDFRGIAASLSNTLAGLDTIVNSPGLKETLDALPQAVGKIEAAADQMQATFAEVQGLAKQVQGDLGPALENVEQAADSANEALAAARETMRNVDAFLDPANPVMYQLNHTLADLSQAAAAVRRFAETLERNPSILIRGKDTEE